jgi:predicted kinase
MKKLLIVITGHPGSGKSMLAKRLSREYRIPFVSKDNIKERIFDSLGIGDKAWSRKVSNVSHRLMDDAVDQELAAGRSVIVESNFKRNIDSKRFTELAQKYNADCFQILCTASGDVLLQRWKKRIKAGERHAGHVEEISLDEIKKDLAKPYKALDIPGELVNVDTTDVRSITMPEL